ncbi:hypothetical protein Pcinc_016119 [Petrolisthes cinctipes]|uniref:Uncharacterized protein n=1 Tax=Petrolisthes cinctipes TaxID=88211 RepID=A0AAE1FSW6_PETCI|nr:hypothetical protein Pcinc_016119 [Petrolisthes cinctipes]
MERPVSAVIHSNRKESPAASPTRQVSNSTDRRYSQVVHEYLKRHGGGSSGGGTVSHGEDNNGGRGSDVSTIPVSHILTRQADLAGPRGPSYVRWDNPDTPLTHRQHGSKEKGSSDKGTGKGFQAVAGDMSIRSTRAPSQSTANDSYMTAQSNFSPHELLFETPPDNEPQMTDTNKTSQVTTSLQPSYSSQQVTPDPQQHGQSFHSIQLTPLSSVPSSASASPLGSSASVSPKMGLKTFMSTSSALDVSDLNLKNNQQEGERNKRTKTEKEVTKKGGNKRKGDYDKKYTMSEPGSRKKCYHNPFSGTPNTTNPFIVKPKHQESNFNQQLGVGVGSEGERCSPYHRPAITIISVGGSPHTILPSIGEEETYNKEGKFIPVSQDSDQKINSTFLVSSNTRNGEMNSCIESMSDFSEPTSLNPVRLNFESESVQWSGLSQRYQGTVGNQNCPPDEPDSHSYNLSSPSSSPATVGESKTMAREWWTPWGSGRHQTITINPPRPRPRPQSTSQQAAQERRVVCKERVGCSLLAIGLLFLIAAAVYVFTIEIPAHRNVVLLSPGYPTPHTSGLNFTPVNTNSTSTTDTSKPNKSPVLYTINSTSGISSPTTPSYTINNNTSDANSPTTPLYNASTTQESTTSANTITQLRSNVTSTGHIFNESTPSYTVVTSVLSNITAVPTDPSIATAPNGSTTALTSVSATSTPATTNTSIPSSASTSTNPRTNVTATTLGPDSQPNPATTISSTTPNSLGYQSLMNILRNHRGSSSSITITKTVPSTPSTLASGSTPSRLVSNSPRTTTSMPPMTQMFTSVTSTT